MAETYNPNKPPDGALVQVLADRFLVDPPVIVAWLKAMDFRAETERQAQQRAPWAGYTQTPQVRPIPAF